MPELDNRVVRAPLYVRICSRCGILGWSFEETERALDRCKTHASICKSFVELTLYRAEKSLGLAMSDE